MNTEQQPKSVYRRGADDGFIFGVYLSLMFIFQALAIVHNSTLLSLLTLIMMLAVPAVIYFFLRRAYIADGRRSSFSALWLQGICTFFFGSLLMAVTVYVYTRLVQPNFMPEAFESLRQAYAMIDTDEAQQMVRWIENAQKHHLYPPASQLAVAFIWGAVFTGSILSMIISFVIRSIHPDDRRTTPNRF